MGYVKHFSPWLGHLCSLMDTHITLGFYLPKETGRYWCNLPWWLHSKAWLPGTWERLSWVAKLERRFLSGFHLKGNRKRMYNCKFSKVNKCSQKKKRLGGNPQKEAFLKLSQAGGKTIRVIRVMVDVIQQVSHHWIIQNVNSRCFRPSLESSSPFSYVLPTAS